MVNQHYSLTENSDTRLIIEDVFLNELNYMADNCVIAQHSKSKML
jgi:hypothetical protein